MPLLGLGTYRMQGEVCKATVKAALRAGYRLIDTADVYKNEKEVGAAIAELIEEGVILRKDVFVTSKIAPKDQGFEKCLAAARRCLENLGPAVEYLDLLLIHWPGSSKMLVTDPRNATNRHESWKALEQLYADGTVRAIGVSNFTPLHLQILLDPAHGGAKEVPHLNQFEYHPAIHEVQQPLVDFCRLHGIQQQAYSSYGEGCLLSPEDPIAPVLASIRHARNATAAQVLLAWSLQRGVSVIPKTSSEARLLENLQANGVRLLDTDLEELDRMGTQATQRRFCWDPTDVF
ncbi:hypothetical protein HKX48_004861 [Thoreauomyces humboldtii]|nr:hypothetical protein HKX48_004861 [Thoreauomyces humboldtii]